MKKRRLLWQIYPTYLLITLLTLLVVSMYELRSVERFHAEQALDNLKREAVLIADEIERIPGSLESTAFDETCKKLGRQTLMRITVILPDGKVVGDSDRDPNTMENHGDRPEFREALRGQVGHSTRYSDTLKRTLIYLGYPLERDGKVVAVVRTSLSLAAIDETLKNLFGQIGIVIFVVIIVAALISLSVSRRITKPVEEMRRGAERFAKGDFDFRLGAPACEEMASLALAMNSMASELRERIQAIDQQRNELEAVLSSMVEGVIAIDKEETVMRMNKAAAELFGVDPDKAAGMTLPEVIRNPRLLDFASKVLAMKSPQESDIVVETDQERYIQATGAILRTHEGTTAGALIVLNDVTRIRQLENIRRDFVANVSHELKTPITSIKGFVETLQDGAANDPENRDHFLNIIAKQSDRLNSIVNDILSLSKLEHDAERNLVERTQCGLIGVLKDAIEVCADRARQKKIGLNLACDDNLSALVNAPLLEQAVVNLIDNAVKYSGERTKVEIEAREDGDQVVIKVRDQGPGIEKIHQTRIFERFYRVDKGRSRQLGGTGLGLSIVKHIALAHKGAVSVESELGRGSAFFIHLPKNA